MAAPLRRSRQLQAGGKKAAAAPRHQRPTTRRTRAQEARPALARGNAPEERSAVPLDAGAARLRRRRTAYKRALTSLRRIETIVSASYGLG